MNDPWTFKEIGFIWGVHPKKAPQAFRPWLEKAVKLWRADPQRFLEMLLQANHELMFDEEIDLRQRIQTGRVDRRELTSRKP